MHFNLKNRLLVKPAKLFFFGALAMFTFGVQPFSNEPLHRPYQADIPPAAGWNPAPGFGPYLGVNSMRMGYNLAKPELNTVERRRNNQFIKINPSNPNLSDAINEPSPFPDKLSRLSVKGQLHDYYRELIKKEPVDHIQSKVFEAKELKTVRRILVKEFENKTHPYYRNENAGKVVTRHIYQNLRNSNDYAVTSEPLEEDTGFRIKIMTDSSIDSSTSESYLKFPTPSAPANQNVNLNDIDAYMIGAVTKYRDSYIDEDGNNQKSLASGIEFGSYLISAKSGKVLWGARYISSQSPGFFEFFKHGGQWKNKESLSRFATRNVLKAFYQDRSQN
jgi:hypothetical protein